MVQSDSYNISALFFDACINFPDRKAIVTETHEITFGQLGQEVKHTIAYFEKKGIKKGDRILVFLGMGIDLYRIVLAIFAVGAVAVFVDEWVNIKRLSMCCKIARCKAIIAPMRYRMVGLFIREIRQIPLFLSHKGQLISATPFKLNNTLQSDSALITFTTGSTGIPKAADRSHGFLKAQFDALRPLLEGQTSMTLLPIVLLMNLGVGITSVIPTFKSSKPESFKADKILALIQKHTVDSIIASPYYLLKLAESVFRHTASVKYIISGGAPVFAAIAEKISHAFTHAKFTVAYGSTEAEPISHCSAMEITKNKHVFGLYAGKPVDAIALKIVLENTTPEMSQDELCKKELPNGNIGEIIVTGDAVNKTYLDNPKAVAENKIKTDSTVWHRTGDSGYLDKNGNLFLTGRLSQIIHHNGKSHYPFVIENKLLNIEGVKAGTSMLIKNKLILVLQASSPIDRNRLSEFEYDDIRYVDVMPYDPRHHSKIDYHRLMAWLQNE